MAKVIEVAGAFHLRHPEGTTLCGIDYEVKETEGDMTCPECAKIALHAMELVTRAEKREWRKL